VLELAENTNKKNMFKLKYFFFFFYLISVNILSGQEVTSYYLIRHAEKLLTNPNNPNPHLTTKGHKRSLEWKKILEKIHFDRIYSTSYYRTLETAKPIADERNLEIQKYDPNDLFNVNFRKNNIGKTTLVVGHSNTTPVLANKIIGKDIYSSIDEKIHGYLFFIQIIDKKITYQLLNLE
tara:strand:- start:47 stop:583 length:537 start_codon:yes stop_codon:yes gene_type:complete